MENWQWSIDDCKLLLHFIVFKYWKWVYSVHSDLNYRESLFNEMKSILLELPVQIVISYLKIWDLCISEDL